MYSRVFSVYLLLEEVMFRLRTVGPVHIHQAEENRVVKVERAACIRQRKRKQHRMCVQLPAGSGER